VVILLFALQWVIGGGAAWVFHLTNILLAVATALAVYWMALALLPPVGAWLAGRCSPCTRCTSRSRATWSARRSCSSGSRSRWRWDCTCDGAATARSTRGGRGLSLLYAVALFSKEHGAVFPILLLAAEWTVVRDDRSWRSRIVALRPLFLALIAVTLAYVKLRSLVQADLAGFAPYAAFRFLNMGAAARIGTMLHEFPRIAQLMLFPTRLSADYSPNDVIIANGIGVDELAGILIVLCTVTLAIALRRRAPVASFGLLWLIVAYSPVSNVLIPTGIVTAERTLFLPSVGIVPRRRRRRALAVRDDGAPRTCRARRVVRGAPGAWRREERPAPARLAQQRRAVRCGPYAMRRRATARTLLRGRNLALKKRSASPRPSCATRSASSV
jgi:hypothetical protein